MVFFGGLISLVFSTMIVTSALVNQEMWVEDAPPEIKAVLPPLSAKGRQQRRLFIFPVMTLVFLLLVWAVARVYQANQGGFPGFWPIAATLQTFNLVDLLVIDWLVLETIRPPFLRMPSPAEFKNRRFYGYHFKGFLKGLMGITLASLAMAAILAGASWVFPNLAFHLKI